MTPLTITRVWRGPGEWSQTEVSGYLVEKQGKEFADSGSATVSFPGDGWDEWDAGITQSLHERALAVPYGFVLSQYTANCEAWTFDVERPDGSGITRMYVGKANLFSWAVYDGDREEMTPDNTIPLGRLSIAGEISQSEAEELALKQVPGEIQMSIPASSNYGDLWFITIETPDGGQATVQVYKLSGILTVS